MSDVLAALAELEKERKSKPTNAKGNTPSLHSSRGTGRARTRTRPLPPRTLSPRSSTAHRPYSERSPSRGSDARSISFADLPKPSASRRPRITTRTDALHSGFPFDPRISRYGVAEEQWDHFSSEIVRAANLRGPAWMWPFQRKEVLKRVKKELQYEGELKGVLRRGNRFFRTKGFQASLELPDYRWKRETRESDVVYETKEQKEQAKREARRFRVVITPTSEAAPSVYSRASSLTRSVTGEATAVKRELSVASSASRSGANEEEEEEEEEE